ncbi:NADH:flavin oxidoreductase [Pseudoflavitalea sp. G-6-1-2]|uniref:NADH:flavin oxidoreductase n=1 Tax=Pseudoflavitalea sp. G-6-1-2 TaxID=2728841 RepID=UPI00146C86D4|nr:NADH:flavin oxidoreductase [Pseudoflavitalea sp. G-6-1-2]NML22014.1 NADH:flavin oxidoreductase [Pseudoflavitalea sp. G-6-1-2]
MSITKHPIFQPLQRQELSLKNRLVIAPMSRVSAGADGSATAEMAEYYAAFAKGGFSMVITEGNYTDEAASKGYPNQPGLTSPLHALAWKPVVDQVKSHGALIIAQLMHAGALSQYSDDTKAPSAVQPVGVKMAQYGGTGGYPFPKAMSLDDIDIVKNGFVKAARFALQAGFDGVELHMANGYLLDQFLTPELNVREDLYGGSTSNRFRIAAEIIQSIREFVPPHFLVGIRLSEGKVNDLKYRWKEGEAMAVEVLEEVRKAAPDFIHIAVQSGEWERDSFYSSGTSYSALAKQITGKVVIANGGMHQLTRASTAIEDAHADLLAIGKAALADPAWPLHTLNGAQARAFHPDMLWPEATIQHTNKIIKSQQLSIA